MDGAVIDVEPRARRQREIGQGGGSGGARRGRGIVANTGVHTELGLIAGMLARVEPEETPLEKDLDAFGKRVVLGCVVISALVFAAGMLLSHQTARELFLVAVALAVAAIPEGLPAVTTIVLALGTQRMAKRHALVRRLPAAAITVGMVVGVVLSVVLYLHGPESFGGLNSGVISTGANVLILLIWRLIAPGAEREPIILYRPSGRGRTTITVRS